MTFDELQLAFKERYQTGEGNLKAVFAPGRINLIGGDANYETFTMKVSPVGAIAIDGGYGSLPMIEPYKINY
jgi:galactokinase